MIISSKRHPAGVSDDSISRKDDLVGEQMRKLAAAVIEGDADLARNTATALNAQGVPPLEVVNQAIKPAMDEVGRKYDRLEVFLPELVLAGEAAQEALKILLTKEGRDALAKGKIVLGTIFGDIHDIGKNITAAILSANGYQVIDIGNDASPDKFVETAKTEQANIIGMSCLLTPSMYFMRDVIRRLKDEGIREKFQVIIGGAAIYPDWAKEIGADGWAKDAERAVQLCDMLVEKNSQQLTKPVIVGEWR
jgi:5-methyltetrahydrofolate--homocysteine methyltransferase